MRLMDGLRVVTQQALSQFNTIAEIHVKRGEEKGTGTFNLRRFIVAAVRTGRNQ